VVSEAVVDRRHRSRIDGSTIEDRGGDAAVDAMGFSTSIR